MRAELLFLALVACTRPPDVVLLCHNANCSPDGSRDDDTISGLRASLAMDPAPFDGVELDLLDECQFGHELPDAPAADATALIADFLRSGRARGDRFHIMLELKRDAVDVAELADCALVQYETLRTAAADAGLALGAIFESFEPDQLAALTAHPRWPGQSRDGDLQVRLSASLSFPAPLGYSHTIGDFGAVELDVVDTHPRLLAPDAPELYRDLGLELAVFADTSTPQLLDAIDAVEPTYVVASQVEVVRAWLDR
jgi:hypothetical protein